MYKLVYTSNSKMLHHIDEEVDIHFSANLLAINKDGKGFSTSVITNFKQLDKAGAIYKTKNSVYIFAYINDIKVCKFSGFGFY
jgi:hypothetical protein